jgi:DNA polymerase
MFLGVAPGESEEEAGLPFVGRAGRYLTRVLRKVGVSRHDVYITNLIKHRPPENRTIEPEEISTCRMFLTEEIAAVRPRVICTLGGIATRTLLSSEARFHDRRGRIWRLGKWRLFPTFHPAYVLRTPECRTVFEADIRAACVAAGLLSR